MHLTYIADHEITKSCPQVGWYIYYDSQYIGPFATHAAAQQEALALEAAQVADEALEYRHQRSLRGMQ